MWNIPQTESYYKGKKRTVFFLMFKDRIKTNYHLIIEEYDRETISMILKL